MRLSEGEEESEGQEGKEEEEGGRTGANGIDDTEGSQQRRRSLMMRPGQLEVGVGTHRSSCRRSVPRGHTRQGGEEVPRR